MVFFQKISPYSFSPTAVNDYSTTYTTDGLNQPQLFLLEGGRGEG